MRFLFLSFGLALAAAPPQPCHPEFSLRDILAQPEFARGETYHLSPDGEWVAYVLTQRPQRPGSQTYLSTGLPGASVGARLLISNRVTGDRRDLCPRDVSCIHPSWSPDGKSLAFVSDEGGKLGLWVVDIKTGKRTRLLAGNVKISRTDGEEPQWSPDGKAIYVSVRSDANLKAMQPENHPYDHPLNAFLKMETSGSIVAVDVRTKRVNTLVPEDAEVAPSVFRRSSTGRHLAYLSPPQGAKEGAAQVWDLAVVPASGGKPRVVARGLGGEQGQYNQGSYRWDPRGERLVYFKRGRLWMVDFTHGENAQPVALRPSLTDAIDLPLAFTPDGSALLVGVKPQTPGDVYNPIPTELALIPLDERKPVQRLTLPEGTRFQQTVSATGNTVWQSGRYDLVVQVREGGMQKLVGYEAGSHRIKVLREGGDYHFGLQSLSSKPIGRFEDVSTPGDLFSFDEDFAPRQAISHVRARLPPFGNPRVKYFNTQLVRQPSGNIVNLNTALVLPPGLPRGAKPPTIVIGYPGTDASGAARSFAGGNPASTVPTEVFLRLGYAVAMVDLPMTPEGQPAEPVEEITSTLLPQIDTLAASGDVDPGRFALMGLSYGGYFAAAVPTHLTPKYQGIIKASVAISGVYDLNMMHATSPEEVEKGQGHMGGPPEKDPERYRRNSPLQNVDKINTPLLIVQGTADDGYDQATKMIAAMKAKQKNGELASFEGEGHVPLFWTLANHERAVGKILEFLRVNLGPGICAQAGAAAGPEGATPATTH